MPCTLSRAILSQKLNYIPVLGNCDVNQAHGWCLCEALKEQDYLGVFPNGRPLPSPLLVGTPFFYEREKNGWFNGNFGVTLGWCDLRVLMRWNLFWDWRNSQTALFWKAPFLRMLFDTLFHQQASLAKFNFWICSTWKQNVLAGTKYFKSLFGNVTLAPQRSVWLIKRAY